MPNFRPQEDGRRRRPRICPPSRRRMRLRSTTMPSPERWQPGVTTIDMIKKPKAPVRRPAGIRGRAVRPDLTLSQAHGEAANVKVRAERMARPRIQRRGFGHDRRRGARALRSSRVTSRASVPIIPSGVTPRAQIDRARVAGGLHVEVRDLLDQLTGRDRGVTYDLRVGQGAMIERDLV